MDKTLMYSLLRPLLFKLEAEKAHHLALTALTYLPSFLFKKPQSQTVKALGLEFPHPIGLAAGLDKNGEYLEGLSKLGFSFIELGTVTPKAQKGNAKPRLFRLPQAQAIINRMGFNNQGVDALVHRIKKTKYSGILGINIGKNKDTSLNKAVEDYLYCFRAVYAYASYVTINISSPNTPDLRQLQQQDYLTQLLSQLQKEQNTLAIKHHKQVPLVVKISPDESEETLKNSASLCLKYGIEGIIATNTTCSRPGVEQLPLSKEIGGLSGKPLQELSNYSLRLLKSYVGNELTLIGVGGVDDVSSAQEKLKAGASLVQIYSGLIYQGPGLVSEISKNLSSS